VKYRFTLPIYPGVPGYPIPFENLLEHKVKWAGIAIGVN
jgi:hypothetical protein